MKKLFKWIARIIVVLVLLIVIAAFVLPMVIDPNDYKDTIEDKIQASIGRDAHLNGEIQWSVFPWLALTFNDVTLDNEKGFKGKNMAEIQQLSAQVKLLPLLKKEIQIGKVSVDDATFTLQISKNGRSNYQGILDALGSGTSSASTDNNSVNGQTGGKLNIAGIILNNINLNYTDAQSKTSTQISNLDLVVGEITNNSPIAIDASMHLNMPDTGMDVDMSTDIIANNILKDKGIQLNFNKLSVNGKLSKDSKQPLSFSLQKTGVIDLGSDTLSFPKILVQLGKANITSNLTGENISKSNQRLSGAYNLAQFDLNNFVKNLTGNSIVTSNILADFKSDGNWSYSGKRLRIPQLTMTFGETKIKGSADLSNLETMTGKFNVHINKLNIDDFLADSESTKPSETANNSSTFDFGHLNGTIDIDSITATGTKLKNIQMVLKTNGVKLDLLPVNAEFYKGLLSTTVRIDTKAAKNKIIVKHKMSRIQAGPLLSDLTGSELLTGTGNLNIDLNIDKPFSQVPLQSAHGNVNYTLDDGAIYGVDIFGMVKKGLSILYPEINTIPDDGIKKTDFALMEVDADINQGILTTNTLRIESPYLHVRGKVSIDLINMTIDGLIKPVLLDIPDQLVSDKYKKLLNLPLPVKLTGPLMNPNISIDPKKLFLVTQQKRIDKEKDKLKGKLMDSLFGKDKETPQDDKEQTKDSENNSENKDSNEEKPKKKESSKDKLKKDLLKGLLGDG